jgi:hypothetical protein
MRMGGQRHVPAALPPVQVPGTHYIGGCVGPRADLDGSGKSHRFDSIRGFDPRTVRSVASVIPNALSLSTKWLVNGELAGTR